MVALCELYVLNLGGYQLYLLLRELQLREQKGLVNPLVFKSDLKSMLFLISSVNSTKGWIVLFVFLFVEYYQEIKAA